MFICLVIGLCIGYTVGNYAVVDKTERYLIPANHNHSDISQSFESSGEVDKFSSFNAEKRSPIFDKITHDSMIVEENDVYYMIVGTTRGEGQELYSTTTPDDASSWTLEDAEYLSDSWEFDSIIEVDSEYLVYGNGDVYATSSVATDNWTKVADNTGFSDLGAYYSEETGRVHVYYEFGDAAGYSGKKIGHAVSPNGIDNWTVYPPVWTAPDGYGVGDFDIVEMNDTIYIFGDYDSSHPRYNVSIWASNNFYENFTQQDKSAVGFEDKGVEYGVGDPSIVQYNGECLMFANMHENEYEPPSVHLYRADCSSKV